MTVLCSFISVKTVFRLPERKGKRETNREKVTERKREKEIESER